MDECHLQHPDGECHYPRDRGRRHDQQPPPRVRDSSPESNGTIYEKTSPLSALSFASGLGTPFVKDNSSQHLNNATTTKQTVDSTTGLLVLAGHETLNQYWFNVDSLGGGPPPTPTPTPTPTPGGVDGHA